MNIRHTWGTTNLRLLPSTVVTLKLCSSSLFYDSPILQHIQHVNLMRITRLQLLGHRYFVPTIKVLQNFILFKYCMQQAQLHFTNRRFGYERKKNAFHTLQSCFELRVEAVSGLRPGQIYRCRTEDQGRRAEELEKLRPRYKHRTYAL